MTSPRNGWLRGVISGAETTGPPPQARDRDITDLWEALEHAIATENAAARHLATCAESTDLARRAVMAYVHKAQVGIACEEVVHPKRSGPPAFADEDQP